MLINAMLSLSTSSERQKRRSLVASMMQEFAREYNLIPVSPFVFLCYSSKMLSSMPTPLSITRFLRPRVLRGDFVGADWSF